MIMAAATGGNPDAITTALIALVGALVGAFLSSATQILVHRLQGQREAAARKREVKAAARIMAADLGRGWTSVQFAFRQGRWWSDPGLQHRLTDNDRRLVAGALTAEALHDVDLADVTIDYWCQKRDRDLEAGNVTPAAQPKELEIAAAAVMKGIAALREISGDPYGESPESP